MTEIDQHHLSVTKAAKDQPELPLSRSGYREERDGLYANRHLHDLVEFIVVNVGGLHVEMSSPSRKRVSVGGPIVVGARESRVHGEGGQLVGISTQNSRMLTQGNP